MGKSIFDRGSRVDVGMPMLRHGRGGHHAAGTCQGANETAEAMKARLIEEMVTPAQEEAALC